MGWHSIYVLLCLKARELLNACMRFFHFAKFKGPGNGLPFPAFLCENTHFKGRMHGCGMQRSIICASRAEGMGSTQLHKQNCWLFMSIIK